MNLTCGRNPWKRASPSDSTFRAYLKDPRMLRTILPLSPELDSILRLVFEVNPQKRITIPQLRHRIRACRRFTGGPGPIHSPPLSEVSDSSDLVDPDVFQLPDGRYHSQPPAGVFTPASTPATTPQTTQEAPRQMPYTPLSEPRSESGSSGDPIAPADFPSPPGQSLWQLFSPMPEKVPRPMTGIQVF